MEKGTVSLQVSRLIQYGLQRGLIAPEDQAYAANRMLALLGLREYGPQPVEEKLHTPAEPWKSCANMLPRRVSSTRIPRMPGTSSTPS